MRGTMTITGLYEWDNTILDGIISRLPEGMTGDELKNALFMACAELELIIPRPDLFKLQAASWAARRARGWQRYYDAVNMEYNPIENYDRIEERTIEEAGSDGSTSTTTGTNSGTRNDTRTPNLKRENKVSAYNESTYQPHDQTEDTGTETNAETTTGSSSLSANTSGTFSRRNEETGKIHGNIGVTTSQQMLIAELDLTGRLDVYAFIADEFKKEFCIMVY